MATVGKVLRSFWWLISPYLTIYRIRLRGREPRDVDVSLTLCSVLDYAKNKAVASDAHVALISTIKRWNSKHTKKAMIWQTDRTSWPYRWYFVCFDSVLSARMMKGCAPDHAQVWAAQRKRACENQVKKVTCLLGNGGRKIIWKPVTHKKNAWFRKGESITYVDPHKVVAESAAVADNPISQIERAYWARGMWMFRWLLFLLA